MSPPAATLWRVFPWDPEAEEGRPFSASFVPAAQGSGRFDLPGEPAGVLYLAETPEHAVGEKVQDLRNQSLDDGDLLEHGHRLALSAFTLAAGTPPLADLCDPETLARLGVAPDAVAARSRATTQPIAVRLHAEGFGGVRWWSAFFGEWHTHVLFRARLREPPSISPPEPLHPRHPVVVATADALGIHVSAR
jgi:hypothetical protein